MGGETRERIFENNKILLIWCERYDTTL